MSLPLAIAVITAALCFATSNTMAQGPAAADTFKAKCLMCHAADGTGNSPAGKAMGVPPFQSPALVKATDAELIAITKSGKGKMPAFAGKIPDDQIKDLIKYVRTLQKK